MKKIIVKSTSTLLLLLAIFFILNIFIPTVDLAMISGSGHDKCFSEQCGPVQHLFHDFTISEISSIENIFYIFTFLILLLIPTATTRPPETPPPRFNLIKN